MGGLLRWRVAENNPATGIVQSKTLPLDLDVITATRLSGAAGGVGGISRTVGVA